MAFAFIFACPGGNPEVHTATMDTGPDGCVAEIRGVATYADACDVAVELADKGCRLIELCGGFNEETAKKVKEAVGDKARVGWVQFLPEE